MSEENVELVRRMYRAFHGGDAEGAMAHFDPEVVVDASARPDGGVAQGHEGLATIIGGWVEAFDGWNEEIEEMRDLGSSVYVVATQRGRGKESGVDVEARYALLYVVRAAKITRVTLYRAPADALRAAGLSEWEG
jgi:ketosteroid isomerase-like protein